jgi:hypothetical protein
LRGDPSRRGQADEPGDDLSKAPYFTETDGSPDLNLLFAALFDLIICRGTKMGLFVPSSQRNLDTIFAYKVRWAAVATPFRQHIRLQGSMGGGGGIDGRRWWWWCFLNKCSQIHLQ